MIEHTYIRVRWLHEAADEPVELWSELNQKRFETRKLEIFRDGSVGYASSVEAVGGTQLGKVAVPPLNQISANPEFEAEEVSKAAFEQRWEARHARGL
jgi:hypothetical protein